MKKNKVVIALTILLLNITPTANSQVLISLLLGDKLNSGKLEFGLDGGVNFLNMSNTQGAKMLFDWNLGFYFDFKLKPENLFLHTGVLVKSKMGTADLPPYPLSNDSLNDAFVGGSVDRKINYFNVPVLLRYRFYKQFFVEGGIQLGLRYTAYDIFYNSLPNKDDLSYSNPTKDNYARLDAGGELGLGYKFEKGDGMTLHVDYYYGFVDVNTALTGHQNNSAIYLNLSIPIGKKKAAAAAAAKAKKEEAAKQVQPVQ